MAHPAKQVRAAHLSSWMEELGFGVLFSRDEDTDDEYLLIQRHFEEPNDGRPYIESDDVDFCGHFRRVAAALSRNHLEISYGSKTVEVTFAASDESFQEVVRILRVLVPSLKEL